MVQSQVTAGNGAKPNRLSVSSRLTAKQLLFAQLFANGLNSAAQCYREAYGHTSTKEWWARVAAYNLARKPHVQAEIQRLKAIYDSARPSLTRASKREILHSMAVNDELAPPDRQRALDIDNKMQGEYQERMHLTQDVTISLFRGGTGAIHWQLAENLPPEPKPVEAIEVQSTNATNQAIALSSHYKAISSASEAQPDPTLTKEGKPRKRFRNGKGIEMRAKAKFNRELQARAEAANARLAAGSGPTPGVPTPPPV